MPDPATSLDDAVADLDDGYLQVMLLLAVRRAGSEEPRRAGLWHVLAERLAAEQDARARASQLGGTGSDDATQAATLADAVAAVLAELRQDLESLEAEYRDNLEPASAAAAGRGAAEAGAEADAAAGAEADAAAEPPDAAAEPPDAAAEPPDAADGG